MYSKRNAWPREKRRQGRPGPRSITVSYHFVRRETKRLGKSKYQITLNRGVIHGIQVRPSLCGGHNLPDRGLTCGYAPDVWKVQKETSTTYYSHVRALGFLGMYETLLQRHNEVEVFQVFQEKQNDLAKVSAKQVFTRFREKENLQHLFSYVRTISWKKPTSK